MLSPTPKTLNCPTCGAPLNYDGTRAIVRCQFCQNTIVIDALKPEKKGVVGPQKSTGMPQDIIQLIRAGNKLDAIKRYRELYDVSMARAKYAIDQIEAGNLLAPESGFPTVEAEQVEQAVKIATVTTAAAATTTAAGAGMGCVIAGFIFLLVGGIIGFAMLQPGGPFTPRLIAMNPAIMITPAQNAAPDVVSEFHNSNEDNRILGRVNHSDSKLAWKTDPLPDDGYVDGLASDGDRVYAAVETYLMAFNAKDGSLVWKISLPDKLDYGSQDIVIKDGYVIVETLDRSIQAYVAETGQQVWSRSLLSYSRELRAMGQWLVILDYIGDGHDFNVFLLNPSDGKETRVIAPVCQSSNLWNETLNDDSGIVYDGAANALFLFYGSSFGCIQRYNLATGNLDWETQTEDGFMATFYGFNYIQDEAALYFGNSQGQLLSLDKQNGALKSLVSDESYDLAPLALNPDGMIVRARRTKGSERFELWGVDPASGERLWQMTMDKSGPVDPPNEMSGLIDKDESGWTWKLVPAGLLVIRFQAEPNQLTLDTYSAADGSNISETVVPLKDVTGDFYSVPTVIGWYGSEMYFLLDSQAYVLDISTGKIVVKYQ